VLPASNMTAYEVRVSCFGKIFRLLNIFFPIYWEEERPGFKKSRNVMNVVRKFMLLVFCKSKTILKLISTKLATSCSGT